MPRRVISKKVDSVFDLKAGDRIRHGANYGTVMEMGENGPMIGWDHGQVDHWYTEDMHQVHPLWLVSREEEDLSDEHWDAVYDGVCDALWQPVYDRVVELAAQIGKEAAVERLYRALDKACADLLPPEKLAEVREAVRKVREGDG